MNEELPRRVPARDGFEWVAGAFRLFLKSPLMLAAAAAIFLGALLLLQFLPYAGAALAEILSPLFVAGFMRAFRSVDEGSEPELPQLAAGFQTRLLPLATVGAAYLGMLVGIMLLMKSLGVDYEAMAQAMRKAPAWSRWRSSWQARKCCSCWGWRWSFPPLPPPGLRRRWSCSAMPGRFRPWASPSKPAPGTGWRCW